MGVIRNDPLRVLMLTWEYPPRIVGGISRVVEGLSKALHVLGVEVHIITNEMPGSPLEEDDAGVRVHRVKVDSPAPNFHAWILLMNHYFAKRVGSLAKEVGGFDIVHAHDWLVQTSASETKGFLRTPLISTLHSMEFRRSEGATSPEISMVESLEWWMTYESSKVIVCSNSMKEDAKSKYKVPDDKMVVIPNGIDPDKYAEPHLHRDLTRLKYGVGPSEKLILFVGRLTHQKGCNFLIRSIPYVAKFHNVRLIIVGDGYMRGELESEAFKSGEAWRIRFTGFLPDQEVRDLMASSNCMVVPSIYEPFGVVALEGMASKLPVVASNVDGLSEIIRHEENGILVYPKDPSSIAWGISRIFSDADNSQRIVLNALNDVKTKYTWSAIAKMTLEAYEQTLRIHKPLLKTSS